MPNEEYALVLDYLPKGRADSYKTEPVAQIVGTQFFTLLEVIPKAELKVMEKIYVGKEERDKVEYIKKRITHNELTSTAVAELEKAIETIVNDDNKRFLDFFNTAGPITIRRHQLELLPSLGKKHMQDVLKERQRKPFESFDDLEKRVRLLPNPMKLLIKRITLELQDDALNHYLFVRPPAKKQERERYYRKP